MNSIVQIPSPKSVACKDFYTKLGFTSFTSFSKKYVTDGSILIELNPDPYSRPAVKLYGKDWKEPLTSKFIPFKDGLLGQDPSGVWVMLLNGDIKIELPPSVPSLLGNYAGISIECLSIEQSLKFWHSLGFNIQNGTVEQGWIGLNNSDGFTLSLMKPGVCPHLFINPSLTYFNGENNPKIIDKIRKLDIPILEEIDIFNKEGIIDNITLLDPAGIGIFVFND